MSLSLRAEVEVLGLLQRHAVLWNLVALVSMLEQAAASVVFTMGVNISRGGDHSRGAWLGWVGWGLLPVP